MIIPTNVAVWLGIITALAAAVVLYILVMPKKKDGKLGGFMQKAHDFFHFKKLYLEEVMKFMYVLATAACIFIGFFMLLGYEEVYGGWDYYYGYYYDKESTFLTGLAMMFLGPVVLRLTYEGAMLFVLLVKNVMEINNKLSGKKVEEPEVIQEPVAAAPAAPAYQPPRPAPVMQDEKICPTCGTHVKGDAGFCPRCGSRV